MSAGTTQATELHARLRADLLLGSHGPGARLRIQAMMRQYGVGQTPLREALNRLAAEGLVQVRDQRGFTVAAISADELRELTRTRCLMETAALRAAMAAATPEWEDALVLACRQLRRTPRSLDTGSYRENPEWERLHRGFHRLLLAPCGLPTLLGFCETLADRLYRYRQIAVRRVFADRDAGGEHQAILDAVLDGDADRAAALLTQHYTTTASVLLHDADVFAPAEDPPPC